MSKFVEFIKDLFTVSSFKILTIMLLILTVMAFLFKIPITYGTISLFIIFVVGTIWTFQFSDIEFANLWKSSIILLGIFLIMTFVAFVSSPIFHTKGYSTLIKVKEINASDIITSDFNKIRKVTEQMALMKANKVLGRKVNGVEINTQYEIDKGYIIKYKNKQYWVFPLQYSGFLKWLNQKEIPGYILVSAVDPYAEPIFVNKNYKYATSSYFFQDVKRIFLLKNSFMPVSIRFEIDENKNPYWIGIGLKYKYFGNVFGVDKIIVMNAKTGEIKIYKPENAPKWIDVLYPENIINDYIEYYGKYRNGLINYITGNNVVKPTVYDNKELWLVENKLDNNLKWFTGMSSKNRKDNSLSSVILVDSKNLNAYIIENVVGIMDEKGAIDAIDSKLGANSLRWTAVLPMAYIKNGKWYWTASIIDKKTYFYQKEGIVDGKNPNLVEFIDLFNKSNSIENDLKTKQKNGKITKDKIIRKIKVIKKELNELENMLKQYKGE